MPTRSSRPNNKRKLNKQAEPEKPDEISEFGSFTQLKELIWIGWVALFFLTFISLVTWSESDGGWFQVTSNTEPLNLLGWVGAYISDFLFFLFGLSSFWWPILFVILAFKAFKKSMVAREHSKLSRGLVQVEDEENSLENHVYASTSSFSRALGFLLLISASVIIEAQKLTFENLVLLSTAGGAYGNYLSEIGKYAFGDFGLITLSILGFFAGLALFFSFSWFFVFEICGGFVEKVFLSVKNIFQSVEDYRLGTLAIRKRILKRSKLEKKNETYSKRKEIRVFEEESSGYKKRGIQHALLLEEVGQYIPPSLSLLSEPKKSKTDRVSEASLEYVSRLIEKRLGEFGVEVRVVSAQAGPVVTRYEIEPAIGVKGAQVVALAKDLARSLSLLSIRVVETIPGKNLMGLELPNSTRELVSLSDILYSSEFLDGNFSLPLALGKDIAGNSVVVDLVRMPHLLVAGTTGAGKSVGINAFLLSLIFHCSPRDIRLILIDPKMLEFSAYEDIPHLLTPVVTDMFDAVKALNWSVYQMEQRYKLMSNFGVRSVTAFNRKIDEAKMRGEKIKNPLFEPQGDLGNNLDDAGHDKKNNINTDEFLEPFPKIVVVIDELADLMMVVGKKVESLIARLAQKARAAGIHLILATQRPSVDVITGLIKANIPARISYQVSSRVDSRTILDQMGAESLLGQGDMLFMMPGSGLPKRVHGAFVADEDVIAVVNFLKETGKPIYDPSIRDNSFDEENPTKIDFLNSKKKSRGEKDSLYDEAVQVIKSNNRASISLVQRHLRIGYNRAARLLEMMEDEGVVSSMQSNGNRDILIKDKK
ncbi:MAG: hypothetical protein CBC42_04725 [Betaproteobacteria bacterium TMED82]|nr:MAG: hypothetical protein CBC42_04725 [Betaproteobacteria bacterium TMED82]